MIETLLISVATVGVAELGDKTQLLVLMLARRFRRPVAVGLGLVAALALSNVIAALFGHWIDRLLPDAVLAWLVGGLFIVIGLWTAFGSGDEDDDPAPSQSGRRVAVSVFLIFLLAELGDKSQLTTVGLSASLTGWWPVAVGATLGAALVNLPVIWIGHALQSSRLEALVRWAGAGLFVVIGVVLIIRETLLA